MVVVLFCVACAIVLFAFANEFIIVTGMVAAVNRLDPPIRRPVALNVAARGWIGYVMLIMAASLMFVGGYWMGVTRYAALEGVDLPVYQMDDLFGYQDSPTQ